MKQLATSAVCILFFISTIKAQINNWQLHLGGGASLPVSTYKSNPGNATTGWAGTLGADKYFKCKNWGVGVSASYFQNQLTASLLNFSYANGSIAPIATSGTTFRNVTAGVGPRYRKQIGNSFELEAFLNGGVMFSKYPWFMTGWSFTQAYPFVATATPTGPFTLGVSGLWHEQTLNAKNNVVQWMGNGGLRANYQINTQFKLYLQGEYVQSIGNSFFGTSGTQYSRAVQVSANPLTSSSSITSWSSWPLHPVNATPYSYYYAGVVKESTPVKSVNVSAGVKYSFGRCGVTKSNKSNSMLTVLVKDELTGQPLRDAVVTITDDKGSAQAFTTDTKGVVVFDKIKNGMYSVRGILHEIPTTVQSVQVDSKLSTVTLLHNDPRFTVVGKSVNSSNSQPVGGVSVSLTNFEKGSVKMGTTQNGTGSFSFQLDANSDYELVGKKASYISNIERISTKGLKRSQTLYVELELGVEEVIAGRPVTLNKIFYDLDKTNIREEASTDLDKIVRFLVDNPTYKIEIASHTDSRGSDEYNLELSQKRAQAVVDYLVRKGIDKNRLIAKGYGETKLVNKCSNGVACSEEEHQQNRRTEFTIISQ